MPKPVDKVISLDTEATGLDYFHGARPYLVTTCSDTGKQKFWEWDVDPLTRRPHIPECDLDDIRDEVSAADVVVMHNSKFDMHMLSTIGIEVPWSKVRDTLLAGHLLASNHRHNLTDMCVEYLGHDIEPLERRVKECTVEARKQAKREFPDWRLAREDDPDMPSVSGSSKRDDDKPWKNDMWVPRALVSAYDALGQPWEDDPEMVEWTTVCSRYANGDSEVTMPLWTFCEAEMRRRGLWSIYVERLKLVRIAYEMERRGVTISMSKTDELTYEYSLGVAEANAHLLAIAAEIGHDLELPAGASPNDSLREMFFGSCRLTCPRCGAETRHKEWLEPLNGEGPPCKKCLKRKRDPSHTACDIKRNPCLRVEKFYSAKAKSDGPSLNVEAMDYYEATLKPGPALDFVKTMRGMRSQATAVSYMDAYRRFWLPVRNKELELSLCFKPHKPGGLFSDFDDWRRLHPSFNPVGTDHLRWSSYNPNGTNISKKEGFNLRRCFGPAPGREMWSMDFKNIELRIPAYESGEEAMIELFEREHEPPYFGSYHLLNASIIYPDLFFAHVCPTCGGCGTSAHDGSKCRCLSPKRRMCDVEGLFKFVYKASWYQYVKNLGFALQYGCGRKKADQTAHKTGAYDLLRAKLPKVAALNDKYKRDAEKYGYVETLPDRSVCAERGYPILASRSEDGHVMPTTPFCYHVSGTAMQCTNRGMVRVDDRLTQLQAKGFDGFLTLQIHDELLFDFPRGAGAEPWRQNLEIAHELRALMERSGDDIGIPTPVACEYHSETWAVGMSA